MPSPSRCASRSSISCLGGALAGAAGATLATRRGRRRAAGRIERETLEREAEREILTGHLVTAEQDERRRLSLVLHDGPLQSLSGIVLMHDAALAALEDGHTDEAVRVIRTALEREREVIRSLRDLSFAIEPVILRDRGFDAAVRALADQIEDARGIRVSVDTGAGEQLAEKAQVALYQTIREALTQASRRSPERISVRLESGRDGGCTVIVTDDGAEERRRERLEAIRERAWLLRAEVSIESSAGSGTVVRVAVPPHVAASVS